MTDASKEIEIYQSNSIWDKVKGDGFITDYILSTDDITLFIEKRIAVKHDKKSCLDIKPDNIGHLGTLANSLRTWLHALAIAMLVVSIILLVFGILFHLLRDQARTYHPVKFMYLLLFILVVLAIWGFVVY